MNKYNRKQELIECCERALCVGKFWEVRAICGVTLNFVVCDVRVSAGKLFRIFKIND